MARSKSPRNRIGDRSGRFIGRIETLAVDDQFVVATGWAADRDGHPIETGLTLVVGTVAHPVVGLFPRDDLRAEGLSDAACAFCIDVPHPGGLMPVGRVQLLVDDEEIWSSDREAVQARPFTATASFDEAGATLVTGWVYDPGLWHGGGGDDQVELVIGDYRLPVTVEGRRFDLPYSAAKAGQPLGFRIAVSDAIGDRYGATALHDLAGADEASTVTLTARGQLLCATTLRFAPVMAMPAAPEAPPADAHPDGFIDFSGYSEGLGGWLFGGWVRHDAIGRTDLETASIVLPDGSRVPVAMLAYPRADVEAIGQGVIGFVSGGGPADRGIELTVDGGRSIGLMTSPTAQSPGGLETVQMVRAIVRHLPDRADSTLARTVSRTIYEGVDTVAHLGRPVFFEVDEIIHGGRDGVLLIGWCVDPTQAIATIRVRSGQLASPPLGDRWLTVDRPDIRDSLGSRFNLDHAGFGFHAYADLPGHDPENLYVELTLRSGEVAFKPLPAAVRTGRKGITRILSNLTATPDTVRQVCGRILGPPVVGIHRDRLAAAAPPAVMALGTLVERPRCSIVVPLYGRLDFMMYQMALMSETGLPRDELVYVLDQPERKAEFLALARSCHRRYAVPARLVLPPENLGFAGASNAGMTAGMGDYVCFLNSDVVPVAGDWLDRLIAALDADPGIGLIGAQLLFEDGTLQHGGMAMKRLPGFGNMPFPYHPGKGRLPTRHDGVRDVPLVTGALMLMRRPLALELGGFDTDYVMGDFEDADLCMKVQARGLRCAVHDGVTLYHLERQSQGSASQAWRQNLTLVNACTFAGRWEAEMADVPVDDDLVALA